MFFVSLNSVVRKVYCNGKKNGNCFFFVLHCFIVSCVTRIVIFFLAGCLTKYFTNIFLGVCFKYLFAFVYLY